MNHSIPPREARELQRQQYWQGQMLQSADFQDQLAVDAQYRWWHNRALHEAYGIAIGFTVVLNGRQVEVKPGQSFDCFGREILLLERELMDMPKAKEPMLLLVRYRPDRCRAEKEACVDSCYPGSRSAFAGRPEFLWVPARQFDFREGVPLARFVLDHGALVLDPTYSPYFSRRIARPRIACGKTIPAAIPWEESHVTDSQDVVITGFTLPIDTSAAGFTRTPAYLAWLQGDRLRTETQRLSIGPPITHVDQPGATGFSFRLLFPGFIAPSAGRAFSNATLQLSTLIRSAKLYVSWIGIQSL